MVKSYKQTTNNKKCYKYIYIDTIIFFIWNMGHREKGKQQIPMPQSRSESSKQGSNQPKGHREKGKQETPMPQSSSRSPNQGSKQPKGHREKEK